MAASGEPESVRLADLMAALSLATDIGTDAGMEHGQRAAILATRLCEAAGWSEDEARDGYYLALVKTIGCIGDRDYGRGGFGLDEEPWASALGLASSLEMLPALFRTVGRRERPLRRAGLVAGAVAALPGRLKNIRIQGEVGRLLAARLGLGIEVQRGLEQVFERWDGAGAPRRRKGEDIARPVRVAQLCADVVAAERVGGGEAALALARKRAGRVYDPALVERLCAKSGSLLGVLAVPSVWDAVLAAEPGPRLRLDSEGIDRTVRAMGEYADLKSRYLLGHSAAVAELAGAAAQRLRLGPVEVRATRRAGYLHDLGRVGVLARIWDKPTSLTEVERERVRLHSYYTERILARLDALAPAPALAALAHERRDGSGYHRWLSTGAVPLGARALAAADVYHALVSERPHRPGAPPAEAAAELRRQAAEGALDIAAVEAVLLSVAFVSAQRTAPPSRGLSDDDLLVLPLVARGLSNGEIARKLEISRWNARHQRRDLFDKIGVTTRPAAALYAMQNDLLGPPAPRPSPPGSVV